jgi:hypothetical protein
MECNEVVRMQTCSWSTERWQRSISLLRYCTWSVSNWYGWDSKICRSLSKRSYGSTTCNISGLKWDVETFEQNSSRCSRSQVLKSCCLYYCESNTFKRKSSAHLTSECKRIVICTETSKTTRAYYILLVSRQGYLSMQLWREHKNDKKGEFLNLYKSEMGWLKTTCICWIFSERWSCFWRASCRSWSLWSARAYTQPCNQSAP